VVLGVATASTLDDASQTTWTAPARQSVADQLRAAAGRTQLPSEVVARLQDASKLLGVEIVSESVLLERDDIGDVLVPGARICFTGTAQDNAGRIVERWEMEELAESAGLRPVKSVSKTRCEVLVTAEAGSQSGKARKALEYGKPVFTADEFLAWAAQVPPRR
jgi:ATP-dependent DNA helicase PIF1